MWFRRDLRLNDNHALSQALARCEQVFCAFLFDQEILGELPRVDRRVEFIRAALVELDAHIREISGRPTPGLVCVLGVARSALPTLAEELGVEAVFANEDYEPKALTRDAVVRARLADRGVGLYLYKDHVVCAPHEVLTGAGHPFSVYTPYRKAWLARVDAQRLAEHPIDPYASHFADRPAGMAGNVPTLAEIGFLASNLSGLDLPLGCSGGQRLLREFLSRVDPYHESRDFPGIRGPSYLGVHLRFGTVSIRQLLREAQARAQAGSPGARAWRDELIWREFYVQVLGGFSRLFDAQGKAKCFKPGCDDIRWETGPLADALFFAWCEGRTGYPLVDAGMRQLAQTGYMHNRLRMVVASFLTKDLGIDWRRGERFFALHLNDFEQASNNGGWQWAASTGCDAQPWFRIFNPITQSERFDPQGRFIARYVPELANLPAPARHTPWMADPHTLAAVGVEIGKSYPTPLVAHAAARLRTLARFEAARDQGTA